MTHHPYKALYIHIPFCVSRCNYCDFTTKAISRESCEIDEYLERVILDIRKYSKEDELGEIETIYIGGGTPTHIGSARLSSLLYALSTSLHYTAPNFEFTIEANPESITENLIHDMWALGVNRLSIGVQSLDDSLLQQLGRSHSAEDARHAIKLAQSRFENISVDVICGIPGQSEDSLSSTLEELIALGVTHVSVYPLAIEPGTPFYNQILAGEYVEPDEDEQANHMLLAQKILEEAGYHRYEVASYAQPGYESKHNSVYWKGIPYLGIGTGATTMTQNDERRMRVLNNEVIDDLNRAQMEAEDLMLGMRMSEGISDERLKAAKEYLPLASCAIEDLIKSDLIEHKNGHYVPTEQGWLCGNELYSTLIDLANKNDN